MIKMYRFVLSLIAFPLMTLAQPTVSFEELLLRHEQNPRIGLEAKQLAQNLGLPQAIHCRNNTLIHAIGIENGQPVYAVITNLAHPFEGGKVLFYDEVVQTIDLSGATNNPTGPIILDKNWSKKAYSRNMLLNGRMLLVPEWSSDKVMAFDPMTGDLVDTAFVRSNPGALASPKEAQLTPRRTITVSDQIRDLVQEFDTGGVYISHFAPAGGVNTAILDNIRGHAYRANGNLIVCVASGANQNSIAEFDSAGNYLGRFVQPSSNGPNGPFSILIRSNDILITGSNSPVGVTRLDLNGTYIAQWAAITSFPQQIIQLADGNVAVANFQGAAQTGIRIYNPNGTLLRLLSGVTGNRGVYQLGNGNFLTTNAAGIHEIDSANGGLVRTIAVDPDMQFISLIALTTTQVGESPALPAKIVLLQNYPNPFNPATTIEYHLPAATHVTLKVVDVLGREVATLVSETQQAGVYKTPFDASRLTSGVYFYRLQAGNTVQSRKLVVLK
ncbi:MAG: T9SS type A sorting domain-containing protein [Bacteroidetes bacterium]|nr:T9SS type A sorting domain-containing protein [Bacteroidota bacterium]MCW5894863.1 T9SS type A sorting domain-containing protein [Bacteroidota bacterium]